MFASWFVSLCCNSFHRYDANELCRMSHWRMDACPVPEIVAQPRIATLNDQNEEPYAVKKKLRRKRRMMFLLITFMAEEI